MSNVSHVPQPQPCTPHAPSLQAPAHTSASQDSLITIKPPTKRGLSLLNLHVKRKNAHFEQIPGIWACVTSLGFRNLKSRHAIHKLTARWTCELPDATNQTLNGTGGGSRSDLMLVHTTPLRNHTVRHSRVRVWVYLCE